MSTPVDVGNASKVNDLSDVLACARSLGGRAEDLFGQLRALSQDPVRGGVTRDTYGPGEARAHAFVASQSSALGLQVSTDFLGNTYALWPGQDPSLPAILIGSHLDSVPGGGNFDGAAGVVAGLLAVEALQRAKVRLQRDVIVMGIRAEESIWFQVSYIGSRGALGQLPAEALAARRIDTGKTLEEHLREAGGDPQAVREGRQFLRRDRIEAFLEVHIEQAPSMAQSGHAVAIGRAIPGHFRYPRARIFGEYGHVGLGRRFRRDAALAGADLLTGLDRIWAQWEAASKPMAFTVGEFHTDAARHGLTIVPGAFHFSLDVRAYEPAHLVELERELLELVARIEQDRGVRFDLGVRASTKAAPADGALSEALWRCAKGGGMEVRDLLSPASHDSAAFWAAGIPYGFIFVRNPNGSHHAHEHMETADFIEATGLLAGFLKTQYA